MIEKKKEQLKFKLLFYIIFGIYIIIFKKTFFYIFIFLQSSNQTTTKNFKIQKKQQEESIEKQQQQQHHYSVINSSQSSLQSKSHSTIVTNSSSSITGTTAAAKLASLSFHHNKANHFLTNKILNKTKSQRYSNDNKLSQKPPKYSTSNLLHKSDTNLYSTEGDGGGRGGGEGEEEESVEMMQKQEMQQHNYSENSFTVPRSRSDLNIVKILNNVRYSRNLSTFGPECENDVSIVDADMNTSKTSLAAKSSTNNEKINSSKSPSLNSLLDTQHKEKECETQQKANSSPNSVLTRSGNNLNNKNNRLNRGSDYTDSGIGHDTNSHRSSIISQGSLDSGTQSNTSSNITAILNCSNYMRDLSTNNYTSKFIPLT